MKKLIILSSIFFAIPTEGMADTAAVDGNRHNESVSGIANVITRNPSVFQIPLDETLKQHLESQLRSGTLKVARLYLENLSPQSSQLLKGVLIFIEKPNANSITKVDDSHYAGNFVLGLETSQSITWNIAPTLSALWRSGALTSSSLSQQNMLTITFVPEAWEYAPSLPNDFALSFEKLKLELPP